MTADVPQRGHSERQENNMTTGHEIALSVGTAISVASGRLLCDFGDLHDAVTDLAGWDVMTHHMANEKLMDGVAQKVLRQVPWMAGAVENMPTWPEDRDAAEAAIAAWLDRIRDHHGDEVVIGTGEPLPVLGLFAGLERLGSAR